MFTLRFIRLFVDAFRVSLTGVGLTSGSSSFRGFVYIRELGDVIFGHIELVIVLFHCLLLYLQDLSAFIWLVPPVLPLPCGSRCAH